MDFIGLLETGKWSDHSHIVWLKALIVNSL